VLCRGRTDVEAKKPNPPQYRGRLIKESWKLRGDAVPENPIELATLYRAVAVGPEQWTFSGNKKSGVGSRQEGFQDDRRKDWTAEASRQAVSFEQAKI